MFVDLVGSLRLEERVAEIGSEFGLFLNTKTASPNGEAFHIEDVRPAAGDLDALRGLLVEKTLQECLGRPEGELLPEMLTRQEPARALPNALPARTALELDSALDVHTNLDETAPWWKLGNLRRDGLDEILRRFQADETPGRQALFHVPVGELARRFGRADGHRLYAPGDLLTRWVRLWAEAEWRDASA